MFGAHILALPIVPANHDTQVICLIEEDGVPVTAPIGRILHDSLRESPLLMSADSRRIALGSAVVYPSPV